MGRRHYSSYCLRYAARLPCTRQIQTAKVVIADIEESEAPAGLASGCINWGNRLASPFINSKSFDRLQKKAKPLTYLTNSAERNTRCSESFRVDQLRSERVGGADQ